MKLKRKEFCTPQFVSALQRLVTQPIPLARGIQLGRLLRLLRGELAIYNEARLAAVKSHGGVPYATHVCPCGKDSQGPPGESFKCEKCGSEFVFPKHTEGFVILEADKRAEFEKEQQAILEEEIDIGIPEKFKVDEFPKAEASGEDGEQLLAIIE
jgi:hypothetical protein